MPDRKFIDDPEFWRSRADGVRAIAEGFKHRDAKAIWNRIADDYERLAQLAEQRRRRSRND